MKTQKVVQTKVDFRKLKQNDIISVTRYLKVKDVDQTNTVVAAIDSDTDASLNIQGSDILASLSCADQFAEVISVNRTEMATILSHSYGRPFTAKFEKDDGNKRTLRGRLMYPEPVMGRSYVEDLDIDNDKNRVRQVDHRTLEELVVDNVKYVLKN